MGEHIGRASFGFSMSVWLPGLGRRNCGVYDANVCPMMPLDAQSRGSTGWNDIRPGGRQTHRAPPWRENP